MRYKKYHILLLITLLSIVLVFTSGEAKVTGNCANCHTMHNSQNGTHMILYLAPGETDTNPKQLLLRGTCLGCHGRNTGSNIDPTTGAPQVLHTGTDLAAGNFRYLSSSDNRGHNVIETGNQEDIAAMFPPRVSRGLQAIIQQFISQTQTSPVLGITVAMVVASLILIKLAGYLP